MVIMLELNFKFVLVLILNKILQRFLPILKSENPLLLWFVNMVDTCPMSTLSAGFLSFGIFQHGILNKWVHYVTNFNLLTDKNWWQKSISFCK